MRYNNIPYSDIILSEEELKVTGKHKTSTIPNVEEDQLEKSLEIIFSSNPNIDFKFIQYSRESKTLRIYTDKIPSLIKYLEYYETLSKPFQCKTLNNKTDILNEIKNLLNNDINTENDCISLYDISNLISNISTKINGIINYYKEEIESFFPYYNLNININFYYNEDALIVKYTHPHSIETEITFSKIDNDLFITKTNDKDNALEFFVKLRNIIPKLYDELENYRDFYNQKKEKIHAVNSNFSININHEEITICTDTKINEYNFLIKIINTKYSYYQVECNSNNILNIIVGQEDEIFKRIFVKISDCPKWSQYLLTEIRQKQLKKENRKKKILTCIQKLCPFIEQQ